MESQVIGPCQRENLGWISSEKLGEKNLDQHSVTIGALGIKDFTIVMEKLHGTQERQLLLSIGKDLKECCRIRLLKRRLYVDYKRVVSWGGKWFSR